MPMQVRNNFTVTILADHFCLLFHPMYYSNNNNGIYIKNIQIQSSKGEIVSYNIHDIINLTEKEHLEHLLSFVMHLQVAIQLHKCTTLVKSLLLVSLKCPRTYNIFSSSFYQKSATVNEIENAIIQFFELLYSTSLNLQQIRKQKYDTMVASDYWKIDPALLPPSPRVVFFHGSRVHRKIVVWKDLSDVIAMGMEN